MEGCIWMRDLQALPTCKYRASYPRTATISPASENTSNLLDKETLQMSQHV